MTGPEPYTDFEAHRLAPHPKYRDLQDRAGRHPAQPPEGRSPRMGNRIKLTEPGSSYIGRVTKVATITTGKWPDYEFTVENGDVVQVPQTAADRQIARLDCGGASGLVGSLVKWSRSMEPGANGKLYHNLDLADPAETKPSKRIPPPSGAPPQSAPQPFDAPARSELVGMGGPPDAPLHGDEEADPYADHPPLTPREVAQNDARSQRERDYLACWHRVAVELSAICHANRIPLDASAVQAACFSVFGSAR